MRTDTKENIIKIQKHIKSFTTLKSLNDNCKAVGSMANTLTLYQQLKCLVEGGNFLIYNSDIKDFLNSLNINSENKIDDYNNSFEMYRHLIAREGIELLAKYYKN